MTTKIQKAKPYDTQMYTHEKQRNIISINK